VLVVKSHVDALRRRCHLAIVHNSARFVRGLKGRADGTLCCPRKSPEAVDDSPQLRFVASAIDANIAKSHYITQLL
jgi:hypothetical protein